MDNRNVIKMGVNGFIFEVIWRFIFLESFDVSELDKVVFINIEGDLGLFVSLIYFKFL